MAGFFGFFDFTKPGPGVPKDAPPKNRFIVFFEIYYRKFWKLVTLNMIYFIACIPIITIGPATAGFTYVLRNFAREEHAWVWSDFKEHTLKNFKQAFLIGLFDLIIAFVLYINYEFYLQAGANYPIYGYVKYFVIGIAIVFTIMHFYMYIMLVTFKLTLKQLYKNAFIFAVIKFPLNLMILFICMVFVYLFFLFSKVGILLAPFILLSTLGFIINFCVYPVIKKYMIDSADIQHN